MNTNAIIILGVAIAVILSSFVIGWLGSKKMKSNQDYFGATKQFGPFSTGMSVMAGTVSAFALVGVNGLIYANGTSMASWMMTSCAGAFAMLLLAKKVRGMAELGPVSSLGDLTDLRYNNSRIIKGCMSFVLMLGCLAYLSSQISAGSMMLSHLMGWSPIVSGLVIFTVVAVYMSFSGEMGGMLTQAYQGVIMCVAVVVMLVAVFMTTGGMGGVMEAVSTAGTVTGPDGVSKTFSPDLLNAWGTSAKASCLAWIFIPIVGTIGQPQCISRMYALKNPHDVPKTAVINCVSHIIVAAGSIFIGYGVLYLVATGKVAPLAKADDAIFVFADYCGLGVQIAAYTAVLAASMSSASLYLSTSAICLSKDLPAALGAHFAPKTQLTVSRITMLVMGIGAIFYALYASESVAILGTFGWGTLMSATFPPFILGFLWKGISRRGVEAGLIVSAVLNVLSLSVIKWPGALPWYINVIALTLATTVIVSLACPDKDKDSVRAKKIEAVIEL